jgi:macrodomain Ter protein organizer (MatP/YcbG family)
MSTTLTIRANQALREALEQRAKTEGKTVSEIVREILEDALRERRLDAKVGHLKGRLELPSEPSDPWRKQIRERNWRT